MRTDRLRRALVVSLCTIVFCSPGHFRLNAQPMEQVTIEWECIWGAKCALTSKEGNGSARGASKGEARRNAFEAGKAWCVSESCPEEDCPVEVGIPKPVSKVGPDPNETRSAAASATVPAHDWIVQYRFKPRHGTPLAIDGGGRTFCEAFQDARSAVCELVNCCEPCACHTYVIKQRPCCNSCR